MKKKVIKIKNKRKNIKYSIAFDSIKIKSKEIIIL